MKENALEAICTVAARELQYQQHQVQEQALTKELHLDRTQDLGLLL